MPPSKPTDRWIETILNRSTPINPDSGEEQELVKTLVKICYKNKSLSPGKFGRILASAFDLLVSAQYYGAISHSGWLYCPEQKPKIFFHYTNCCPRGVLTNKFYFHPSNKPESGKIGTATSRLLLLFYQEIFKYVGYKEIILKGIEPVDAVIINKEKGKILFAEIKASPLLTLPISAVSERLTKEIETEPVERGHSATDNSNLFNNDLQILVPIMNKSGQWVEQYFKLGGRRNVEDHGWAFRGLIKLLQDNLLFFANYFNFWNEALKAYHPKANDSIFWLTNACGTPAPIPKEWPARRRGEGYESVSDSKTSVGMDRTDDIKKGIYQVLKLGSVGKPYSKKWDYKVGLISNIHSARHFEEYLESLKDVVWTLDSTGKARNVRDLPGEQALYNLFDGIIALTSTMSRDKWVEDIFSNLG